jgi:hypothetical protein
MKMSCSKSNLSFIELLNGASRCSCSKRFTSHAAPYLSKATYRVTFPCTSAASLMVGLAMRSLLLVLVLLVMLSYVPPGKMDSFASEIRNSKVKRGVKFYKSETKED